MKRYHKYETNNQILLAIEITEFQKIKALDIILLSFFYFRDISPTGSLSFHRGKFYHGCIPAQGFMTFLILIHF